MFKNLLYFGASKKINKWIKIGINEFATGSQGKIEQGIEIGRVLMYDPKIDPFSWGIDLADSILFPV